MALILSLHVNDGPIWLGDDIQVSLVSTQKGQAKLSFTAPDHVEILRDKIKEKKNDN